MRLLLLICMCVSSQCRPSAIQGGPVELVTLPSGRPTGWPTAPLTSLYSFGTPGQLSPYQSPPNFNYLAPHSMYIPHSNPFLHLDQNVAKSSHKEIAIERINQNSQGLDLLALARYNENLRSLENSQKLYSQNLKNKKSQIKNLEPLNPFEFLDSLEYLHQKRFPKPQGSVGKKHQNLSPNKFLEGEILEDQNVASSRKVVQNRAVQNSAPKRQMVQNNETPKPRTSTIRKNIRNQNIQRKSNRVQNNKEAQKVHPVAQKNEKNNPPQRVNQVKSDQKKVEEIPEAQKAQLLKIAQNLAKNPDAEVFLVEGVEVQKNANIQKPRYQDPNAPYFAPWKNHPQFNYLKNKHTLDTSKLIQLRSSDLDGEGDEPVDKPTVTLILKPIARAVAGLEGKAMATPLARAIVEKGSNADILFEPDAVAIVGPGGIAHAQSELDIGYIV